MIRRRGGAVMVILVLALSACSEASPVVDVRQGATSTAATPEQASGDPTAAPATESVDESAQRADRGERSTLTADQQAVVDPTGVIAEIIDELGGDSTGAPRGALEMGNAVFCGFDIVRATGDGREEDPTSRACFTDGFRRQVETMMVQSLPLTDTEQTIHVYRVDPSLNAITSYAYDGIWSERVCNDLNSTPEEGPEAFVLSGCA